MAFTGTFSPADVVIDINGYQIEDYAQGSFIRIVQNSKNIRQQRGIRGKNTRVRTRDRSGYIVIRVMQSSQDNEVLSKIAYEDDLTQTGRLTVVVKDTSGQSAFLLVNAYLEGYPDVDYSSDTTVAREWRIYYDNLGLYNLAGNKAPPIELF